MADREDRAEAPVEGVDSGLVAFLQLLAFLQVNADARQILHERGGGTAPFDVGDMLRTAKRLGIKARSVTSSPDKLPDAPLPAIAEARDGGFFLIARATQPPAQAGEEYGMRALIQRPDAGRPELWTEAQLAEHWTGRLVLMTREALAGSKRRFDVTWFLPFLVKYRQPLIQVLVASFVIQIVALVSPIFFQLIIDKVLVNGTLSTLDVLAIGLSVVFFWETLLTSARQ
ncbi:MAG TPA: cysteine peptidase family C39 domain-containing protein [Sphingomonas sp.]|jgi:subfamily B ATP-binding cassette protein HlyB/CyaB